MELEFFGKRAINYIMGVTPHSSVSAFFHEVVSDALQRKRVQVSSSAESYLVGLLGEFTKTQITSEALSVLYASGATDPGERVRNLKEVGDTTLYVSGFFGESLSSKLVDTDYYIGLGEAAYRELAAHLHTSRTVSQVYQELAAKFPRFVDVLAEVRSNVNFVGSDLVKLYEEWRRTRAEWIERKLRLLGVLVHSDDDDKGYLQ